MLEIQKFKRGGVHPKSRKEITKDIAIENAIVPKLAKIPLQQHIGTPAKCIVKKDDVVSEGELLGVGQGFISANIHTPISGKVIDIVEDWSPVGTKVQTVHIAFEGAIGQKFNKENDWQKLPKERLVELIRDAGIVGLGGAMFPTAVKFSPPKDVKIKYLLINGVECEPYLTADYRLMLEKRDEIINGIRIAKKILGVNEVFIGIENDKMDAANYFEEALKDDNEISVVPLRVQYPQGGEKQLIEAVLKMEVPEGKIPLDINTVVINVGTAFAINEAVIKSKPLFERIVTVTGSIVKKPGNYKVRIGTPIKDLLDDCGLTKEPAKIIMGGPMMGMTIMDPELPVIKGTSGILVLSKKEAKKFADHHCIHCGMCVDACPVGLIPQILVENIFSNRYDASVELGLLHCIECGCCSYVCPAKIHLVQYFKAGKLWHKNKVAYTEDKTPIIR